MKNLVILLVALFTMACTTTPETLWTMEEDSGKAVFTQSGNVMDITAPNGLTLWYNQPLKGDYRITYTAQMPMAGNPYQRLSDMNCFWGAVDPENPDDIFVRSAWRNGTFKNYNTLNLFYVGYGGNNNQTTRFRRYHGEYYGKIDSLIKPLLKEYTDPAHLLEAKKDYAIEIIVKGDLTTFTVNGEELFRHDLTPGMGDGWFGIRLWDTHIVVRDFKVEEL